MMSRRLWLLWFVLWDGGPTFTATLPVYSQPKGTDFFIKCHSIINLNVIQRVFCRNDCREGNMLVQTSGSKQINGRYSMEHEKKGYPPVDYINVKISNLTLSDSGRYHCIWDVPVQNDFYSGFRIEVTDGEKASVVPFTAGDYLHHFSFFNGNGKTKTFCRNPCFEGDILVATTGDEAQSGRYMMQYQKYTENLSRIIVRIKNMSSSDSGLYWCLLDKKQKILYLSATTAPFSPVPVTVSPGTSIEQDLTGSTWNLPMILILISAFVFLCIEIAILIICFKRRHHTDPGTVGAEGQTTKYENVCPESEDIYQDLNMEDMDKAYNEINQDYTGLNQGYTGLNED